MAAHAEGLPALAADTVLVFQQANPKTPNTQSYQRYEKYKAAQTLKEFIELGGSHKDLKNDADSSRKFVSINADIYSPAAADTCKQIIAAQKKKKRQAPVDDDVGSTEAPPPAGEDPTKVSEGTTQDSELDSKNTQMVTQPAYFDFDSKDIMLFGHSALTTGPHVLAQCVLEWRDGDVLMTMGLGRGRGVYVRDDHGEPKLYAVLWVEQFSKFDLNYDRSQSQVDVDELRRKKLRVRVDLCCVRITRNARYEYRLPKGSICDATRNVSSDEIVGICELINNPAAMRLVDKALEDQKVTGGMFITPRAVGEEIEMFIDAACKDYKADHQRRSMVWATKAGVYAARRAVLVRGGDGLICALRAPPRAPSGAGGGTRRRTA